MTEFFLRTMGMPVLFGPDGRPIRLRVNKHLALLVYLAVEPRMRLRRESLAELLWPAGDQRHSLSTALSVIRTLLGRDALVATPETVHFTFRALEVDIDRLGGRGPSTRIPLPPMEIEPFLDGFDVGDAEGFVQWRDGQAARLRPLMRDAILERLERSRRRGELQAMEAQAQRLFALDELDEDGVRAQMEVRVLGGDRVGALALFERWRAKLVDELGAEPSVGTADLVRRLRRGDWERSFLSGKKNHVEARTDRLLFGREEELEHISAQARRVSEGESAQLVISGAPGTGKSRLLEATLLRAQVEGATILYHRCARSPAPLPLSTLHSLVVKLRRLPGIMAADPASLDTLTRFAPRAAATRSPEEPFEPTQPKITRRQMAECFADALRACCDERPVALAIDDLCAADRPSRRIIQSALESLEGAPLLVAITVRSLPLALDASVFAFSRCLGEEKCVHIDLRALSTPASGQLFDAALEELGVTCSSDTRRRLLQFAGGHPELIGLTARDFAENGVECAALDLHDLQMPRAESARFHREYKRIADAQLADLDAQSRTLVQVLAVAGTLEGAGPTLTEAGISLASQITHTRTLDAARLLEHDVDGMAMVPRALRSILYTSTPEELRRRLHEMASRPSAKQSPESSQELKSSWHLFRARRDTQSGERLLASAESRLAMNDPHAASLAIGSCLPLLRNCGLAAAADWLLARASASMLCFQDTQRFCARLAPDSARSAFLLAVSALGDPNKEAAAASAAEAIHLLAGPTPIEAAGLSARCLARYSSTSRDLTLAASLARAIDKRLQSVSCDGDRAQLKLSLAIASLSLRDIQRLRDSLAELELVLPTLSPSAPLHQDFLIGKAHLALCEGQYGEAAMSLKSALATIDALSTGRRSQEIAASLAAIYCRLGDIAEQVRWGRIATMPPIAPGHINSVIGPYHLAIGLMRAGSNTEARAATAQIELLMSTTADIVNRSVCAIHLADLYWLAGRKPQAIDAAHSAIPQLADIGGFEGMVARWTAVTSSYGMPIPDASQIMRSLVERHRELDALDRYELAEALEVFSPEDRLTAVALVESAIEYAPGIPRTALYLCEMTVGDRRREAGRTFGVLPV